MRLLIPAFIIFIMAGHIYFFQLTSRLHDAERSVAPVFERCKTPVIHLVRIKSPSAARET